MYVNWLLLPTGTEEECEQVFTDLLNTDDTPLEDNPATQRTKGDILQRVFEENYKRLRQETPCETGDDHSEDNVVGHDVDDTKSSIGSTVCLRCLTLEEENARLKLDVAQLKRKCSGKCIERFSCMIHIAIQ